MGFLLCGVLAFFSGVPLLLFPRELPSVEKVDSGDKPVMMTFVTSLKELPNQTKKLFSNFTWLFISLCIICELSITTGFVVFIAKYFQVSFDLSASMANIITGAVIIPGACAGILTGSLLMRWLNSKLALAGIVKFLMILSIFPALAVVTLLFLGCKKIDLAGITSNYYSGTENSLEIIEVKYQKTLKARCNANCACSQSNYMPVCGFDQKTYYSPCHAGCTELDIYKDLSGLMVRNYSSCQCIYQDFVHSGDTAFPGKCDNSCYNLIPFLVILFFIIFLTACGQNPSLIITLRSVDPKRRSFALGIQNFLSRILALIPAPMFFGRIFDSQCLLRSPGCERDGACLEYDTRRLPFVLFGTCLGIKLLSIVFLSLTYMSCRHSHDNKVPSGDITSSNPDNMASDASTLNSTSTITVSTVCSQL
ncbi:Solute carrier organic anion transporter family member 5A1 [Lamellibrachia satsuma]|nr:Solute carrier organic anion transporter family member 5A1 [Lamellibrachia satsuma]